MTPRKAIEDAVKSSRLPFLARYVMMCLAADRHRLIREGNPQPFTATISLVAESTGMSRSAAAEYVISLERAGWISRSRSQWSLSIGEPECRMRDSIPPETRASVMERDGHACTACGATADLTLDHIHPWSLGGSDDVNNLRVLCRPCNSRKGARV